jgi:leucyl-tRNA synthetase
MRFNIELPVSLTKEEIIKIILDDERAKKWIGGSTPSNIIVVPNRIVNIVIKG